MTIKSSNYENEKNKIVNGDDMIVDVDAVAIEPVEDPEALVTDAVAKPVGTPERKPAAVNNNDANATNSGVTNLSQSIVQAQPVGRQSDLFCGSCCDLVRATIIVDIIAIVNAVFNMCIALGWLSYVLDASDLSIADHDPIFDSFLLIIGILDGIGILVLIGSIYGALKFKKILVLFAGIYFIFTAIFYMVAFSFQVAIFSIFFAYPHIALYRELNIGRITSENYAIEKYCCC